MFRHASGRVFSLGSAFGRSARFKSRDVRVVIDAQSRDTRFVGDDDVTTLNKSRREKLASLLLEKSQIILTHHSQTILFLTSSPPPPQQKQHQSKKVQTEITHVLAKIG